MSTNEHNTKKTHWERASYREILVKFESLRAIFKVYRRN